jgi:hypothetical protein
MSVDTFVNDPGFLRDYATPAGRFQTRRNLCREECDSPNVNLLDPLLQILLDPSRSFFSTPGDEATINYHSEMQYNNIKTRLLCCIAHRPRPQHTLWNTVWVTLRSRPMKVKVDRLDVLSAALLRFLHGGFAGNQFPFVRNRLQWIFSLSAPLQIATKRESWSSFKQLHVVYILLKCYRADHFIFSQLNLYGFSIWICKFFAPSQYIPNQPLRL